MSSLCLRTCIYLLFSVFNLGCFVYFVGIPLAILYAFDLLLKKNPTPQLKQKKVKIWVKTFLAFQAVLALWALQLSARKLTDFGVISNLNQGIITIKGLGNPFIGELLVLDDMYFALVTNITVDSVKALVFTSDQIASKCKLVKRCKQAVSIPLSPALFGNVVDCLGNKLTSVTDLLEKTLTNTKLNVFRPVELKAPGILKRAQINEPLITGVMAVDMLIPVGRGQRELILGDRSVGKTTLALTSILNQRTLHVSKMPFSSQPVYCVYVSIGQKASSLSRIVNILKKKNCLFFSVVVAATASEAAALQFLAPYTGCTIGEWLRDRSMHALVVYDDLSSQAVAYRQISLLLQRPPGREAYPGDIFYLHSRLLERSGKFRTTKECNGTLTALPIVETFDNELSAFIPTNVISITDGQLFLDPAVFYTMYAPAVSFKLSVSRVGSKAQLASLKTLTYTLKYALLKFQDFISFNSVDSVAVPFHIRQALVRGHHICKALTQKQLSFYCIQIQYLLLEAALLGVFNRLIPESWDFFKTFLVDSAYLDERWHLLGALTVGLRTSNSTLMELVTKLILPVFLFDKVNAFFYSSKEVQQPLVA